MAAKHIRLFNPEGERGLEDGREEQEGERLGGRPGQELKGRKRGR